uniref:Uncharacterized protein n=1 Tax=Romanomermis culicivorax TaxID=13658 RepID=A0A915HYR4_ROMCU
MLKIMALLLFNSVKLEVCQQAIASTEVALEWNDQSSIYAGTLKTEYVRDSNCHFKAALKWRAFRYELSAKLCPIESFQEK